MSDDSKELVFKIIFGSGAVGGGRVNDLDFGEEIAVFGDGSTEFRIHFVLIGEKDERYLEA